MSADYTIKLYRKPCAWRVEIEGANGSQLEGEATTALGRLGRHLLDAADVIEGDDEAIRESRLRWLAAAASPPVVERDA